MTTKDKQTAWVILGGAWLLIFAVWVYGPKDHPSGRPIPPGLPIDKSAEMQAGRKEFIDKMVAQQIFSEVRTSSGNKPYVYVTSKFLEGDNIQDKETIISVVYAFYYDGTNDLDFVQLLDSRTGKPIGTYSLVQGGLKWNERSYDVSIAEDQK